MQFIFNGQLLPLSTQSKCAAQYFVWQAKQAKRMHQQEALGLQSVLDSIILQETQQSRRVKPQLTTQEAQSQFYEANIKWKACVESKVLQLRAIKAEQKYNQQAEDIKATAIHARVPSNYQGPIEGWQDRFTQYIAKKSPYVPNESTFTPSLCKRSVISQKCVGTAQNSRVEDRLLKYGQELKLKRAQALESRPSHSLSLMQVDQMCSRLYQEGEALSRAKVSSQVVYSFKPETNVLSPVVESRIQSKRRPLYEVTPKQTTENTSHNQSTAKRGDFRSFLVRNQIMLDKKHEIISQKAKQDQEQFDREKKACTFKPSLNSNSLRMAKSKINLPQSLAQELTEQYDGKQGNWSRSAIEIPGSTKQLQPLAEHPSDGQDSIDQLQEQLTRSLFKTGGSGAFSSQVSHNERLRESNWQQELNEVESRIKSMLAE